MSYVPCGYGYKLGCGDDQLSMPLNSYLAKDPIHEISQKSNYCSNVIKIYFTKELPMTEKDNQNFERSTKCWICGNSYVDGDVRVRNHCHITGKSYKL